MPVGVTKLVFHTHTHAGFRSSCLSLPSPSPYTRTSQAGFDVNAELMNGRNPLHYAADYGHADMLEYLLSKGAKIDVRVEGGR